MIPFAGNVNLIAGCHLMSGVQDLDLTVSYYCC